MGDAKQIYAFITKLPRKMEEEFHFVIAPSFEEAQDKILQNKRSKSILFKCYGTMSKDQVKELFTIEQLDPINTAAALRYAADEYGELITEYQKINLVRTARKIESSFLLPNPIL